MTGLTGATQAWRMASNSRLAALRGMAEVAIPTTLLITLAWIAVTALIHRDLADTESDAQRQNANLVLAFEQHTLSTIQSVDQVLQLSVQQYRERGKIDLRSLVRTDWIEKDPLIVINITDAAGQVIASSRAGERPNFADRAFFARHRDNDGARLLVNAPVQGRTRTSGGRTVIPMSRRIEHPGGGFGGVVVAGIDPGYFGQFYRKMEMGREGLVLLVGLDGATRARRAGEISTSGQDMRGSTLFTQQALAESGNFMTSGRLDGMRRYLSYRTLREFGLVLAVGTSEQDVLAEYIARRNIYLAAGALFSLLVALFAALAVISVRRQRQFLDKTLRSEAQFRATFDQAAVGVAHVGLDGGFLKVNDTLCRLAGYSEQELLGRGFADLKQPQDRAAAEELKKALIEHGSMTPVEGEYLRKDGGTVWAAVAPALVRDPQGRPEYFVAMVQDITARKAAQAKLLHQAQFDPLTDLPNRAIFSDRLALALRQARRQKWAAGVMFIDLDRFKAVNDTLGHAAGDAMLREVARRLAASVRTGDTAARVGGDEFAVVLAQLRQPQDAAVVADKILKAMAAPMSFEGHENLVTVSIGIALFPDHGQDETTLLRRADAAMFEAKQAGSNTFRIHGATPGRAEVIQAIRS